MRTALLLVMLLAIPGLAGENAFDRGSLAGGVQARWKVSMPSPRIAWVAPGEDPEARPSPEVALRFEGTFQEGGPREHLEILVGESTPRAMYLAARTRVSYEVLARFSRRDSEPFELTLTTRGAEIEVTCDAYAIRATEELYGHVPLRGTARLRTQGEATGELLEMKSLTRDGELPPPYEERTGPAMRGPSAKRAPARRYSPLGEESP